MTSGKTMPSIARHVSRARAERLVALGRLFACTIAVVTASIGLASRRGDFHELWITGGWWLFALGIMWHTHRRPYGRTSPYTLVVDLLFIASLIVTSGGVASAYFPLIVTPPFGAQLLYGRRSVMGVAAGGVLVYLLALAATHTVSDPRIMIMRLGLVILLGTAVVKRAGYDERVQQDIERLATWPQVASVDRDAALHDLLQHAALTLRVSNMAAAWRDSDGATWFARIADDAFEIEEEVFDAIVADDLQRATSFLDPGLRTVDGSMSEWNGPSLSPRLAELVGGRSVIGARFGAQTVSGWLFAVDRRDANADDLMLAEIVARLFSAALDQMNFAALAGERAASSERLRLSRDLHDGLLQSLSGLALHAQGARRAVQTDPQGAQARLQVIVEQLTEAQRELRDFVDELRPEVSARKDPVRARLEQIARSVTAQWSVAVELHVDDHADALNPSLAAHVSSILAEALTNAAKHAAATRISASIGVGESHIHLDVIDDGHGFPFHGRYELSRLIAEQRGPWSLKERIVALGGELAIDSSARGSRVEVWLPRAS